MTEEQKPMRRIRGAAFVSLDGVMQAPGGPTEDPSGGFGAGGGVAGVLRGGGGGAGGAVLAGVMQAPGGPTEDPSGGFGHGGWLPQFFDEGVGSAIDAFFAGEYDLLLGRRTYEIFAAYWPYVGGDVTGIGEVFDLLGRNEGEAAAVEMGRAFTRARKYVLTRGDPDTSWSNSHRLGSVE